MLWFASYFQNQSPSTWQEQHHQEKMEDTAKLIQQNDEVIENQRKQYEASLKIIGAFRGISILIQIPLQQMLLPFKQLIHRFSVTILIPQMIA